MNEISQIIVVFFVIAVIVSVAYYKKFLIFLQIFRRSHRNNDKSITDQTKILRKAKKLYQSHKYLETAKLLHSLGKTNDAVALLENKSLFSDAAKMLEEKGKHTHAAMMYSKLREWEKAGIQHQKAHDFDQAATAFKKAGQLEMAIEMYRRSSNNKELVRALKKVGHYREAVAIYLRYKKVGRAISMFDLMYQNDFEHWSSFDPNENEINALIKWVEADHCESHFVEKIFLSGGLTAVISRQLVLGKQQQCLKILAFTQNKEYLERLAHELFEHFEGDPTKLNSIGKLFEQLSHDHIARQAFELEKRPKKINISQASQGNPPQPPHANPHQALQANPPQPPHADLPQDPQANLPQDQNAKIAKTPVEHVDIPENNSPHFSLDNITATSESDSLGFWQPAYVKKEETIKSSRQLDAYKLPSDGNPDSSFDTDSKNPDAIEENDHDPNLNLYSPTYLSDKDTGQKTSFASIEVIEEVKTPQSHHSDLLDNSDGSPEEKLSETKNKIILNTDHPTLDVKLNHSTSISDLNQYENDEKISEEEDHRGIGFRDEENEGNELEQLFQEKSEFASAKGDSFEIKSFDSENSESGEFQNTSAGSVVRALLTDARSLIHDCDKQAFSNCILFKQLTSRQIDALWDLGFIENLKENDSIHTFQDHPRELYIILSGSIGELHDTAAPDIGENTLYSSDFFGEKALLKDASKGASYTAKESTLVIKISASSLETFVEENPNGAIQLFKNLTEILLAKQEF